MTKPTSSIQKTIILLVFLCAALITSLFVVHMRKPSPLTISDNVTLLPVGRDIKPFKLITHDKQPFTQKDFYQHWTLLVFGFTHCSTVCPMNMNMLKHAYAQLHPDYPNLQVVLISLDPERDDAGQLAHYVHTYHADFIGVTGKLQEIRKFQSQFGIYSGRDKSTSGANYQLIHTPSILLVNPYGKLSGVFQYGMNPDKFSQVFTQSIKALSTES